MSIYFMNYLHEYLGFPFHHHICNIFVSFLKIGQFQIHASDQRPVKTAVHVRERFATVHRGLQETTVKQVCILRQNANAIYRDCLAANLGMKFIFFNLIDV